MRNNVTMKDIADKIGVSSVTVSKALNDKEGVSDELKERIKILAKEMGYRFNTAARSMKEGLSFNIGVIIPKICRKRPIVLLTFLSIHFKSVGETRILWNFTYIKNRR